VQASAWPRPVVVQGIRAERGRGGTRGAVQSGCVRAKDQLLVEGSWGRRRRWGREAAAGLQAVQPAAAAEQRPVAVAVELQRAQGTPQRRSAPALRGTIGMRPALCLTLHLPLPHSVPLQPPTSPPPASFAAPFSSSESAPTSGTSTGMSCETVSGVRLKSCCRRSQLEQCHEPRLAAGQEEPH